MVSCRLCASDTTWGSTYPWYGQATDSLASTWSRSGTLALPTAASSLTSAALSLGWCARVARSGSAYGRAITCDALRPTSAAWSCSSHCFAAVTPAWLPFLVQLHSGVAAVVLPWASLTTW